MKESGDDQQQERVTAKLLSSLKGLRYGSIVVTVHDSKIVQIERIERFRFDVSRSNENGDGI
jgi:hypothetical protein